MSRPLLFMLFAVGFILSSCREEKEEEKCWDPANPDCENYDPCYSVGEVSANFLIEGQLGVLPQHRDIFLEDSLFISGTYLRFKAFEKEAYYKWYLGSELIEGYGDSLVIRRLIDLPPGLYPASLVVEKTPNYDCHPQDDGRDSVIKYFRVIDPCDLMIRNRFRGVFDDLPEDSIDIEFVFADLHFLNAPCSDYFLHGINLMGPNLDPESKYDTIKADAWGLADSRIDWVGSGGATLNGTALLNREKGTIHLDYSFQNIERVFNGIVIK